MQVTTTVEKTENEVVPLKTSTETCDFGSVWQKDDLEDISKSCLPCTVTTMIASKTVNISNLFNLFGLFFFNQCSYSNTMADRLDDKFDSLKAGTA